MAKNDKDSNSSRDEAQAKLAAKEAKRAANRARLKLHEDRLAEIKKLPKDKQKEAKKKLSEDEVDKLMQEAAKRKLEKIQEKRKDPDYEAKRIAKINRRAEKKQASEAKIAELESRLAASKEASAKAKAARVESKAQSAQLLGSKVADELFSTHRIRIYKNGYIEIGLGLLSEPEKLISIEGSADMTKKSALGRGLAGLATTAAAGMPLNALSPNRRGDLTLTIVTDKESRVLYTDNPTTGDLKALRLLDAVGKSVLQVASTDGKVAIEPEGLSQELEQLFALKQKGILSESEFTAAKKKLLG